MAREVPIRALTTLVEGLALPEGPRWHQGRLYFSDMHMHAVYSLGSDGERTLVCEVPNGPSGLGWLPDGSMLVVSMDDRRVMRFHDGRLEVYADLQDMTGGHCNDMLVDSSGRAYVGNFGFDFFSGEEPRPADLLMIAPDRSVSVVATGLEFPNGMAATRDGKTLIVAESLGHRLTAFDILPDGTLRNRRVWADIQPHVPDGIALDAEGAVWAASVFANQFIRVLPDGRIVESIPTEQMPLACAFGGEDGRTLFLLTSPSIDPEESRALRQGRISAAKVDAPGADAGRKI